MSSFLKTLRRFGCYTCWTRPLTCVLNCCCGKNLLVAGCPNLRCASELLVSRCGYPFSFAISLRSCSTCSSNSKRSFGIRPWRFSTTGFLHLPGLDGKLWFYLGIRLLQEILNSQKPPLHAPTFPGSGLSFPTYQVTAILGFNQACQHVVLNVQKIYVGSLVFVRLVL